MIAHFKPFMTRAGLVRDEYEFIRGYARLTAKAAANSPYKGMAPTSAVRQQGFDVVPCLSPAAVPQLRETLFDGQGQGRFRQLTADGMADVLQRLLPDALHLALATALGSDYAFVFGDASTAVPLGPDATPVDSFSYLWHCDAGPKDHLKILLYLDDVGDHDGATALLDRDTSQRLALTGYNFCPLEERLPDLTALAAEAGVPLVEHRLVPRAGEAIVFAPAVVLHRGVPPTFGRRRVFTVGVVPFPAPWSQTLPALAPHIQQNRNFDFPPLMGR